MKTILLQGIVWITLQMMTMRSREQIYRSTVWITLSEIQFRIIGINTQIIQIFVQMLVCTIIYQQDFPKNQYVIILIALIGSEVMISGTNLLDSWQSQELLSQCLYILQSDRQSSGIKYQQQSAFTSVVFLMGIIIIYGETGTLNYENLQLQQAPKIGWQQIFITIAFKQGQAPLHSWVADVYEKSAVRYALIQSVIPKIPQQVICLSLVEVCRESSIQSSIGQQSIVIGSVGQGIQISVKRFVAFSGIGHMGYVMIASGDAFSSMQYYIIYAITTLVLLSQIALMESKLTTTLFLKDLAGLFMKNPAMALSFTICFMSLSGIPPVAGFYAKYGVLMSVQDSAFYTVAIIAIISSSVSSAYYLKIIKIIYLDKSNSYSNLSLSQDLSFIIAILTLIQIIFYVFI